MKIIIDYSLPNHKRHFHNLANTLRENGINTIEVASYLFSSGYEYFNIKNSDHNNHMTLHGKYHKSIEGRLIYFLRTLADYCHYRNEWANGFQILRSRARNTFLHGASICNIDSDLAKYIAAYIEEMSDAKRCELLKLITVVDRLLPPPAEIVNAVKSFSADLWLITQLPFTQYNQVDILKACQKIDVPCVYAPFSWDNLTTKGRILIPPTAILSWNEQQQSEVVLHEIPLSTELLVVGSTRFSSHISSAINNSEQLRKNKEYIKIIYLCSSGLIAADEHKFIRKWIMALRSSRKKCLENALITIRPHPRFINNLATNLEDMKDDFIYSVSDSVDDSSNLVSFLETFDLVVAANTSAELEAALAGHLVHTVYDPAALPGITDTYHFRHLANEQCGNKIISNSLEEHIEQLCQAIDRPFNYDRKLKKFISGFIFGGSLSETPESRIGKILFTIGAKGKKHPEEQLEVRNLMANYLLDRSYKTGKNRRLSFIYRMLGL